jgi:isopenicillin-N epimerase
VPNATTGVNLAARSLDLGPDDEVLAPDLEYGACDLASEWVCRRTGARYIRAPIPLPLLDPSAVTDRLFAAASEHTCVLYVSHVTSSTGLVLPVEEIVTRARAPGLVTVVDGAHAPAQVPLDLDAARRRLLLRQCSQMARSAQGHGLPPRTPGAPGARRRGHRQLGLRGRATFSQRIERQGTRDPAAWLAVPEAIRFQAERDWDEVRDRCQRLAHEARRELCALLGTEPIAPDTIVAQMATVRPPHTADSLSDRPFAHHRVEIPVDGKERDLLRLSVAASTTRKEIDRC